MSIESQTSVRISSLRATNSPAGSDGVHHDRTVQGLSRFFEGAPDRFIREAIGELELDHAVGQQPQGPEAPATPAWMRRANWERGSSERWTRCFLGHAARRAGSAPRLNS